MAKKRKTTGPSKDAYNTVAERDAARRGKVDPYPAVLTNKTGEVSMPLWITDQVHPEVHLSATIKTLAAAQQRRLWEQTFFMSLYANVDFMSPYWGSRGGAMGGWGGGMGGSAGSMGASMPRMSDNRIRMNVDSLAGKLVQSNSRVVFQTRDGDWSEWKKARKLEMAIEGEFAKMKLYREAKMVAVDAVNQGDGFLKLYPDYDNKAIVCERVFPNEIFVDELQAAYGQPLQMYQLRYARKDDVFAWYPDKYDIIKKAGTTMPPKFAWTLYQPGMVEVYEAWSLPYGERKGRHIIAVSSGVLLDEEWDKPYFPIIRFKGGDRPFGWYGAGMTEQVATTQINLNKILNIMQRAAHLGIAPYWVVPEGSNINIDHLTNGVGHVVQTSAQEPKWVTNTPFHPEAVNYVKMNQDMIDTFFGMSQMEVTGELPINRLDSKQALVEYQNMGSVRHTLLLERWEEFFVEVAERVCMVAVDIAKANGGYPVMVKRAYAKAVQLDWKDLEIEKDAYMMSPAPSNILPFTNAGKIQKIQDLKTDGLISPAQAARLTMGPADVHAVLSEVAADEDDIDRLIEQFTEFEEYRAPTSLQNLPRAMERVAAARLKYANLGATDAVLRLFDRFLTETKDLVQMLTQQASGAMQNVGNPSTQPPGPPGPGGPPGSPPAPAGGPPGAPVGPPPGGQPPAA